MTTKNTHHPPDKAAAIITAGGIGTRMGAGQPKQFLHLAGKPILVHTVQAFQDSALVDTIIVTAPAEHLEATEEILKKHGLAGCKVVTGGVTRQDSVEKGMQAAGKVEFIAVHDGVRPLVTTEVIQRTLEGAAEHGAAIAAIPVKDTIKQADGPLIGKTVDREGLWQAQTPQTVQRQILEQAYEAAHQDGFQGTDEASLLERIGQQVALVEGSERNIKVTRPEDLPVAEALVREEGMEKGQEMRIGHGYDAHCFTPDRPLVLGGVTIPHDKGLLGHSDADVLTHALCDALLGAMAAGDIGQHFPDSDPQYKGIDSLKLLAHVIGLLTEKGYRVQNADLTIVAQEPKLASFLPEMRQNLAQACRVEVDAINIKATTTEKMGFTGRSEGIACHGVVLVSGV